MLLVHEFPLQARLCIEIDPYKSLPEYLFIESRKGLNKEKMEFDWKPNPCTTFKDLNHTTVSCPTIATKPKPVKQVQVWVKKTNSMAEGPHLDDHTPLDPEKPATNVTNVSNKDLKFFSLFLV